MSVRRRTVKTSTFSWGNAVKKSMFTAIVSGVALGVIVLGAIIFGTSVSLAQGGSRLSATPLSSVAGSAPMPSNASVPADAQVAEEEPEPAPPAPPAGPVTGSLQLSSMGGDPAVIYNVAPGEDCSGETIMNYTLPNDGSESELHLSNEDGSCSSSVSFGISDRMQACLGHSAVVFELRVNGAVVQSLTYTVTGPATGCDEFN
jgi:hypothetical protein